MLTTRTSKKYGIIAGTDNGSANCYSGANGNYAGFDCAAKVLKTGSTQY